MLGLLILTGAGHFESALSRSYPQFDILNAYIFDTTSKGHTAFVMTINPAAGADAAATFSEKGLYNFHLSTNTWFNKGITYTVQFNGGNVELARINNANGRLGTKGKLIGSGLAGQTVNFANGMKLWTGVVYDPFFGNAAGIQAFVPALGKGKFSPELYDNGQDFFKQNHVAAIVLEVPNDLLGDTVDFFTSTVMEMGDKWVQINRQANPLMTHLFLLGDPDMVARLNASRPGTDKNVRAAIYKNILTAVTLAASQDDPKAYAEKTARKLFPDVLHYKVGTPASYTPNIRNGIRLSDDGMNTVLSLFSGMPMDDKVDTSHHYQRSFPYVLPVPPKATK